MQYEELKKYLGGEWQNGKLIPAILHLEYSDRADDFGKSLSKLHNEKHIDLTAQHVLDAISALNHNDFWMIFSNLTDAIEGLEGSFADVFMYAQCLVEKAGDDGCANMPYQGFIKWCEANEDQAKLILDGVWQEDKVCKDAAVFALQGLGSFTRLRNFLESGIDTIKLIGLRALGRINNMSQNDDETGIENCLDVVRAGTQGDTRTAAIEAAFRIWNNTSQESKYKQQEFIECVLRTASDNDKIQLAAMLFYHSKAASSETIRLILSNLKTLKDNHKVALNWIERALTWKDERWCFADVVGCFKSLLPQIETQQKAKDFHSFCDWVWEASENSSVLFATWLNSGNFSLCQFLADMVGGGGKKGSTLSLLVNDLPKEAVDQTFLARKCVGHLWLHEVTAASILFSIIESGHDDAKADVEGLLWYPLFLSYGGKLREYIEGLTKSSCKDVRNAAKKLIQQHDDYILGLKAAEDLHELEPSTEARRAAALKDRDRNADIQKMAQKESVLASLFHTSTMLYGKQSFTMVTGADGGKFPSINPLGEFSYSFEFPRLSVVDPIGFNSFLIMCRAEQRIES